MSQRTSHRHGPHDPAGRSAGAGGPIYVLDRESVRSVDRAAIEEYAIPGIILMENASRALAAEAIRMLGGPAAAAGQSVLIVCGSGNNGGDGWALARHLHNASAIPVVVPLGDPKPDTDAGLNCAICRRMGIAEIDLDQIDEHRGADLIVDAIFGTGLDREIRGRARDVIEWINAADRPVLAVDVPSGMDCDTGQPLGVAVRAARTVSFVGYKPGFNQLAAQPLVGEVVIGDIGAPRELTEEFGQPMPVGPPDPHRRGGGQKG